MPLTTPEYRTYAPFDKRIQKEMRARAYSIKTIGPSGEISEYKSANEFLKTHGENISHKRSRLIYAEMFLGDSVEMKWVDNENIQRTLIFTRVK
ncbi:hypothetical protein [Klebsiella quasipneumoniae]|uniref:hypothetical protein n=1 Tax=Klebsiella quasipneumoniae TaxID=1463165 RepID=UPI0012B91204|nr:hypothetical protein [Klebsiella quasipneumoniae]